jgi:hypothetical protein
LFCLTDSFTMKPLIYSRTVSNFQFPYLFFSFFSGKHASRYVTSLSPILSTDDCVPYLQKLRDIGLNSKALLFF